MSLVSFVEILSGLRKLQERCDLVIFVSVLIHKKSSVVMVPNTFKGCRRRRQPQCGSPRPTATQSTLRRQRPQGRPLDWALTAAAAPTGRGATPLTATATSRTRAPRPPLSRVTPTANSWTTFIHQCINRSSSSSSPLRPTGPYSVRYHISCVPP